LNDQFPLLPAPTGDELRELRSAHNWSASEAARAFWLADGRRWRDVECGASRMSGERWTLGLLALGEHPGARLVKRPRRRGNTDARADPATVEIRRDEP
jgi:hypothetical protein